MQPMIKAGRSQMRRVDQNGRDEDQRGVAGPASRLRSIRAPKPAMPISSTLRQTARGPEAGPYGKAEWLKLAGNDLGHYGRLELDGMNLAR